MTAARVVVADDSAFMRRLISDVLTRAGIEVVAEVTNGREAIEACRQHEPDVLSLDLAMPEVDGIEVLKKLRTMKDMRTVVVSSFSEEGGVRAVDALAEGAFELVPKTAAGGKLQDFLDDLLLKVEAAIHDLRSKPRDRPVQLPDSVVASAPRKRLKREKSGSGRIVVIASSTGGPRALTAVAKVLPDELGQGLLIVQHMPAGFTKSLADRLDSYCGMKISEASTGEKIRAGTGYVAQGGRHLRVKRHRVELSDEAAIGGLRPCADITIADVVTEYGGDVVLAVLTGMGRDASKGARLVRDAGGVVLAEHADTTTVYGMPRAVVEAGLADAVLPIGDIGPAIVEAANA